MGFSCCNCSKRNLKESLILPVNNPNVKPIENRNLKEVNDDDNIGENYANDDTTLRTIDDQSKKNVNLKKTIIKGPKHCVSILYGEVGIIDSQIRIKDKNKN